MDTDAQRLPETEGTATGRALRARRRSADEELRWRTLAGRHLPTVEQLLRGYPFASGQIGNDSTEFAAALEAWCADLPDCGLAARLAPALAALRDACTTESVGAVAAALGPRDAREAHPELLGAFLRCRVYLAHLGSERAAMEVAADAIRIAYFQDWETEGDGSNVVWQSLGWLLRSAYLAAQRLADPTDRTDPSSATSVVRVTAAEFEAWVRRCVEETSEDATAFDPPTLRGVVGPRRRPIPERD